VVLPQEPQDLPALNPALPGTDSEPPARDSGGHYGTPRAPRTYRTQFRTPQDLPLSSEYGTHKTDSGLGFQVEVLKPFQVAPSSLGSGILHPESHGAGAEPPAGQGGTDRTYRSNRIAQELYRHSTPSLNTVLPQVRNLLLYYSRA